MKNAISIALIFIAGMALLTGISIICMGALMVGFWKADPLTLFAVLVACLPVAGAALYAVNKIEDARFQAMIEA